MLYYSLKVLELRKETIDTMTIVFKQPALKKITYKAGQYLSVIFRINGRQYIRPYSFSSTPLIDSTIEITVKRVPGGVVSNHIIDNVKAGDVLQVIEALGDFTTDKDFINSDTNLVLWGAGSGITPLMSILKQVLNSAACKHVTLVYGNRHTDAVIFKDKIEELKNAYPQTLKVFSFYTTLSVNPQNHYTVQGRIDPLKVLTVLSNENNLRDTVHYICGPNGLKESLKTILPEFGIPEKHILTEDFEIVRNPADFKDVITANVIIKKSGVSSIIEVPKGKSILDAGLDALIEIPYSCQIGDCLLCRAKIIKGKAKLIGVKKDGTEIMPDETLLCCSFPLTNNMEIQID